MADKKISQLTAATLPLAGTEVLPIVQSNATDNITINNLAAGNLKSQSTTGVLQVSGPGAGSTRVMTVPNANFTAARTDAAQSFTGDQTLSTGNVIQGTAAKGFNFTANTPTSVGTMSSQLLNWYEEGTWTPSVGGTATYTARSGKYTRIGNTVHIYCSMQINTIGTGSTTTISGLPFSSAQRGGGGMTFFALLSQNVVYLAPVTYAASVTFEGLTAAASLTTDGIAIFTDNSYVIFSATYFV